MRVTTPADLPATLPAPGRYALTTCRYAINQAHDQIPWDGRFRASVVLFRMVDGEPAVRTDLLTEDDHQAMYIGDMLAGYIRRLANPPAPGTHCGVAVIYEAAECDPDVELAATSAEELSAQLLDLIAAGRARQFRAAFGTAEPGWRFAVHRARHADEPTMTVWQPGEGFPPADDETAPPAELVPALTELNLALLRADERGQR